MIAVSAVDEGVSAGEQAATVRINKDVKSRVMNVHEAFRMPSSCNEKTQSQAPYQHIPSIAPSMPSIVAIIAPA